MTAVTDTEHAPRIWTNIIMFAATFLAAITVVPW